MNKQVIVLQDHLVSASGLLLRPWCVLPLLGICVFIEGAFCTV